MHDRVPPVCAIYVGLARPAAEDLNSFQLIFRGCNRIGKLQLARKELKEIELARPGDKPDWVAAALEMVEEA
jgi:hypothetical protein